MLLRRQVAAGLGCTRKPLRCRPGIVGVPTVEEGVEGAHRCPVVAAAAESCYWTGLLGGTDAMAHRTAVGERWGERVANQEFVSLEEKDRHWENL